MKVIVVYESLWGNTAAVARAIAEGIGPDAQALSTAEATVDIVAGADLVVAGAPIQGFRLPNDAMRAGIDPSRTKKAPDLSAPTMRHWLTTIPGGRGRSAAFETKIHWSPGGAAATIEKELERAGYAPMDTAHKFFVSGTEGPLKDGELERARAWGAELRRALH